MIELAALEKVGGKKGKDKDVVLFALSTCPHCKHARQWLDSHEVEYRFVYVDKLQGDQQKSALEESGRYNPDNTFPTLVIDGYTIIGFRESEYEDKLS